MTKASLDALKIDRHNVPPPRRGWLYAAIAVVAVLISGGAVIGIVQPGDDLAGLDMLAFLQIGFHQLALDLGR